MQYLWKKEALICLSHCLVSWLFFVWVLPLISRILNRKSIVPLHPKPVKRSGTIMRNIRRKPTSSLLRSLCPEPTLQAPTFKKADFAQVEIFCIKASISTNYSPTGCTEPCLAVWGDIKGIKLWSLHSGDWCELFQGYQEPLTKELTEGQFQLR